MPAPGYSFQPEFAHAFTIGKWQALLPQNKEGKDNACIEKKFTISLTGSQQTRTYKIVWKQGELHALDRIDATLETRFQEWRARPWLQKTNAVLLKEKIMAFGLSSNLSKIQQQLDKLGSIDTVDMSLLPRPKTAEKNACYQTCLNHLPIIKKALQKNMHEQKKLLNEVKEAQANDLNQISTTLAGLEATWKWVQMTPIILQNISRLSDTVLQDSPFSSALHARREKLCEQLLSNQVTDEKKYKLLEKQTDISHLADIAFFTSYLQNNAGATHHKEPYKEEIALINLLLENPDISFTDIKNQIILFQQSTDTVLIQLDNSFKLLEHSPFYVALCERINHLNKILDDNTLPNATKVAYINENKIISTNIVATLQAIYPTQINHVTDPDVILAMMTFYTAYFETVCHTLKNAASTWEDIKKAIETAKTDYEKISVDTLQKQIQLGLTIQRQAQVTQKNITAIQLKGATFAGGQAGASLASLSTAPKQKQEAAIENRRKILLEELAQSCLHPQKNANKEWIHPSETFIQQIETRFHVLKGGLATHIDDFFKDKARFVFTWSYSPLYQWYMGRLKQLKNYGTQLNASLEKYDAWFKEYEAITALITTWEADNKKSNQIYNVIDYDKTTKEKATLLEVDVFLAARPYPISPPLTIGYSFTYLTHIHTTQSDPHQAIVYMNQIKAWEKNKDPAALTNIALNDIKTIDIVKNGMDVFERLLPTIKNQRLREALIEKTRLVYDTFYKALQSGSTSYAFLHRLAVGHHNLLANLLDDTTNQLTDCENLMHLLVSNAHDATTEALITQLYEPYLKAFLTQLTHMVSSGDLPDAIHHLKGTQRVLREKITLGIDITASIDALSKENPQKTVTPSHIKALKALQNRLFTAEKDENGALVDITAPEYLSDLASIRTQYGLYSHSFADEIKECIEKHVPLIITSISPTMQWAATRLKILERNCREETCYSPTTAQTYINEATTLMKALALKKMSGGLIIYPKIKENSTQEEALALEITHFLTLHQHEINRAPQPIQGHMHSLETIANNPTQGDIKKAKEHMEAIIKWKKMPENTRIQYEIIKTLPQKFTYEEWIVCSISDFLIRPKHKADENSPSRTACTYPIRIKGHIHSLEKILNAPHKTPEDLDRMVFHKKEVIAWEASQAAEQFKTNEADQTHVNYDECITLLNPTLSTRDQDKLSTASFAFKKRPST